MCSIHSTAIPRSRSPATVSTSAADSASVSPPPISSRRSTAGSTESARASSRRLRCMRPSPSARRLASWVNAVRSSTSRQRSYASRPRWRPPAVAPTSTFSNTVIPANGRGTWWVRAMPSLHRSAAPLDVTSRDLNTMLPVSGASEPASTLSNVVLPAPLGPTTPTASPGFRSRLTPSSTASAPKRLRTSTAARTTSVLASISSVLSRIRLQCRRDRHLGVGCVFADHEIDRPLRHAFLPLASDDRGADHVGHRGPGQRCRLRPVEVAHRGLDRKRLHRVDDLRLVLRVAARLQHGGGDVEQREARAQLLVPLLASRRLIPVAELFAGDARQ